MKDMIRMGGLLVSQPITPADPVIRERLFRLERIYKELGGSHMFNINLSFKKREDSETNLDFILNNSNMIDNHFDLSLLPEDLKLVISNRY